ncbi:MurR/RpiR family transcriptional regulator [Palleronia sp. LCG004]|uniref:MurR/RpiR family transcriptional regulator n=1 Tax=Palleronia sp. LCG004 TaxID=3079304 RepID=UPI002943D8CA|nr:MurR/RpiR family transcriptional regulator [Palleronia sp. LCG004]WOI55875.1 MurR/RpiR family transcriptional regulator [Palleronia sp. LCG004]
MRPTHPIGAAMQDEMPDIPATPPPDVAALHRTIEESLPSMPKRLKQCGEFVLRNPQRIAVSNVAEIAQAAGVQPSAFVRFCKQVGFSGFSAFQKVYKTELTDGWPTYDARLARFRELGARTSPILLEFAGAGRASLDRMVEGIDHAALERAVGVLSRADMVHIAAMRRSFAAATYLFYTFDRMRIPANLHGMTGGIVNAGGLRPKDALIAISYAPYSSETIDLAREARLQGLKVVAITDKAESPLARHADEILLVREIDVDAFRTLTATLVLATTLAVGVGAARKH